VIVIGLMSGTSYDGIEAAAADLEMDGNALILRPLAERNFPYPEELRRDIAAALPPATTTVGVVCRLDVAIGQRFAEAAEAIHRDVGGEAQLVVSHGQTLFHWVEDGHVRGSLQVGQAAWIAELTGLPVVSDLRTRDIAAGGQGAPLVAKFDALMLSGASSRCAALNLGGIANLTVVDPDREPLAYDVGPGNALIDAAVHHFSQGRQSFDRDGRRAASGRLYQPLLADLMSDSYYVAPPPKSTGKERFNLSYLLGALERHGSIPEEDVIATVTALTAAVVATELKRLKVAEVFVSGGGTANKALMDGLANRTPEVLIRTTEAWGISSPAKEAYAFATLGFLTVHGHPGGLPSCTGARRATLLGSITPGTRPLLLAPSSPAPILLRVEASRTGGSRM
jgi:anhydro-N-acetylmuramic acid kinase